MTMARRLVIMGAAVSLVCLLLMIFYGSASRSRAAIVEYVVPVPGGLIPEVPPTFRAALTAFVVLNPPSTLVGLMVDRTLSKHLTQVARAFALLAACVPIAAVWWWALITATRPGRGAKGVGAPLSKDESSVGSDECQERRRASADDHDDM